MVARKLAVRAWLLPISTAWLILALGCTPPEAYQDGDDDDAGADASVTAAQPSSDDETMPAVDSDARDLPPGAGQAEDDSATSGGGRDLPPLPSGAVAEDDSATEPSDDGPALPPLPSGASTEESDGDDQAAAGQDQPAEQPAPAVEDDASKPLAEPKLLVTLPPEHVNTPDAMVLMPDGAIILSVPNFNDDAQPPVLVKITPDNEAELFYELPEHPETGRVGALGITRDPDSGDLYLADWQGDADTPSRALRIELDDQGKPVATHVVAEGLGVANAVRVHQGYLYVTDTAIDADAEPGVSGVFRFKLGEEGVELTEPLTEDPHFVALIPFHNKELRLGADGMCFDSEGRMYIGNFGDGTIHRIVMDDDGNVTSNEIFAEAPFMPCADGLDYDPQRNQIYVADSMTNAIHIVSVEDGSVQTLARNGDTDGTDGGMDQPCEPLLRGDTVVVSNMDWPLPGLVNTEYNKPATLSVIELPAE